MKMEMLKKSLVIAGAAALAVTGAKAADATVGADFASAYVFRGATVNDEPVMQPYLEVSGLEVAGKAITVGTWANWDFTNEDTGGESGEFTEIDFYGSIDLGGGFGLGYTEYTYPGSEGDADKEVALSYGTSVEGIDLSVAAYYGIGGGIAEDLYVEAGAEYGMDISEDLSASVGATVGYLVDDGGEDGFSNYTLSGGVAYALSDAAELSASLTYIGEMDDKVLETDVEVVGAVGVSYSF